MTEEILKNSEEKMKKAIKVLTSELSQIRTGRASPAIIEKLPVECYGTTMILQELATISAPDVRTLIIQPFDKTIISAIEKAINKSELGLTPQIQGNIIRLNIPPLTEERRRELVKLVKKEIEMGKVSLRNIRREAKEEIEKAKDEKKISEDEMKKSLDKLQKLVDRYIEEVDKIFSLKEKEIMEI